MKGSPTLAVLINMHPYNSFNSDMYWDFVCEWDCFNDIHY